MVQVLWGMVMALFIGYIIGYVIGFSDGRKTLL